MFITIEGCDGTGKTTQAKLLAEQLKAEGFSVLLTKQPGGSEDTKPIREILVNHELDDIEQLFLFLADRAYHVRKTIKPALELGMIVICDRYQDSTEVYQRDVINKVYWETQDDLRSLATRGLEPDLTIILDIEADVAIDRLTARGNNNVLDSFDVDVVNQRIERFRHLLPSCDKVNRVILNGNQSILELHDQIQNEVRKLFLDKG